MHGPHMFADTPLAPIDDVNTRVKHFLSVLLGVCQVQDVNYNDLYVGSGGWENRFYQGQNSMHQPKYL